MIGNTQEGCDCLSLTDFPKYPYYPQYITIEVYSTTVGSEFTVRKRVKLIDCNGDDPTCEEYYNIDGRISNDSDFLFTERTESKIEEKGAIEKDMIVYDILGHLIYKGTAKKWTKEDITQSGIYLFLYTDQNGNLIRQEKRALIKNF